MDDKLKIFNLQEVEYFELGSEKEKFSLSAVLSDSIDFKKIFVHYDILSPGKRSSLPHTHSKTEEMMVVLGGNPTVVLEDERTELKPGDFIGFQPGEKHVVENQSREEVKLLFICSKDKDDQITYG